MENDEGELVGFGCTDAEARVPGVEAEDGTVDVGYGLRPDLTGGGSGHEYAASASSAAPATSDVLVREAAAEGVSRGVPSP